MRVGIDGRKIGDFGIGTYIRGLLGALIELGGSDEYVAFAPAGVALPRGIEHVVVDAPHYSIRELIAVGRAADGARLDVFHAPHYVVPFTSVPVVVTIHDLIHLHHPPRNPLAPLYARTMIRRAIRKAARVLTVSESVKGELVREVGADPSRVDVTPNGVDAIFFRGAAAASGGGGEQPPRRFFLYAGNDKPHKNVETLVDAFARVRRELPGLSLVLAGAPFERFRDRDGVDVRGFVPIDTLAALYREAIAVIVPSLEEGFGLPAAEAMASGVAVITSDAPSLVEITGDAALHAGARDGAAFAEAMLRVAGDASLRASLASRGAERARSFTWTRCATLTRNAYRGASKTR
jgi:glycosyltransferase involved in cell wall biosynthesis